MLLQELCQSFCYFLKEILYFHRYIIFWSKDMRDPICLEKTHDITITRLEIVSSRLGRTVKADAFVPAGLKPDSQPALLLINDGQDMEKLGLTKILADFFAAGGARPLVCLAIHAGENRKLEYGTAGIPDYMGRGSKAGDYTIFVFEELLPFIRKQLGFQKFSEKLYAGFSLGALSAMDIVWAHPHEFTRVGVFSGSLWWRTIDQDDPAYDDDKHRIMHDLVRKGNYASWLKFFFMTGTQDETNDRNNNGIIDSIDDTLGLMAELERKGYDRRHDMHYLELADGRHDVETWARAMPAFLSWALGG